MFTSKFPESGQYFLRRARHFARRELAAQGAALPVSVRMLSHFLLHLSGANATQIALWEEARREALLPRFIKHEDVMPQDAADWAAISRRDIAKHLIACMAILGRGEHCARITALAEEMGQISFEVREGDVLRFPCPSRLVLLRHVVEVAS
jgi:hypothetical protein